MAHDLSPLEADELLKLSEIIAKTEQVYANINSFDTWFCLVNISSFLDGGFNDWPANIQDGISKAVARDCIPQQGERVEIIVGKCYQDMPDEPPYLRVVVQAFPILVH